MNLTIMSKTFLLICLAVFSHCCPGQDIAVESKSKYTMVDQINAIRSRGCQCGGKYYGPAAPLSWDDRLEKSALKHGKYMSRNRHFSHISKDGSDIGDRLDEVGYNWQYAGENLGEGQRTFEQVLRDWLDSPTHCKMLMDDRMAHVAVVKYGKYWVQHFGKLMPKSVRRIGKKYYQDGRPSKG